MRTGIALLCERRPAIFPGILFIAVWFCSGWSERVLCYACGMGNAIWEGGLLSVLHWFGCCSQWAFWNHGSWHFEQLLFRSQRASGRCFGIEELDTELQVLVALGLDLSSQMLNPAYITTPRRWHVAVFFLIIRSSNAILEPNLNKKTPSLCHADQEVQPAQYLKRKKKPQKYEQYQQTPIEPISPHLFSTSPSQLTSPPSAFHSHSPPHSPRHA